MVIKLNPFTGEFDLVGTSIGAVVTGLTQGSVLFGGVGGVLAQDNANLFWDDTNNRIGIGTTTPFAQLTVASNNTAYPTVSIGSNTPYNFSLAGKNAILVHQNNTNPLTLGGGHAVRDESIYTVNSGTGGYASFDSQPQITGALAYDHFTSFQSRPIFNGSGSIGIMIGMDLHPVNIGSGTVNAVNGVRIYDTTGTGPVTYQTGIYMEPLTKGSTSNYAIYVSGNNPTYLGGTLQANGNITSDAGYFSSLNFSTFEAGNSVYAGYGAKPTAQSYYLTNVGYNAGHNLAADSNFNTFVGASAGLNTGASAVLNNTYVGYNSGYNATGSRNVFLGFKSGYYETGSNKIIIDNLDRTTEALGRSNALIYGISSITASSQILSLGGGGNVGIGTTAPVKPLVIFKSLGATALGGSELLRVSTDNDNNVNGRRNEIGFGLADFEASALIGSVITNSGSFGTADLYFATRAVATNVAPLERMRITSNGNVGIGTNAPNKALEINSATGACLRLTYNDSNGSAANNSDFSISSGGNLTIAPTGLHILSAASVDLSTAQTTVNGSVAGTAVFSQPFQGSSYKKVIIYCNGLNGTASYTFPTAFTNTPVILTTSGLAAAILTTLNTTTVVATGAVTTGFLIVEGY